MLLGFVSRLGHTKEDAHGHCMVGFLIGVSSMHCPLYARDVRVCGGALYVILVCGIS